MMSEKLPWPDPKEFDILASNYPDLKYWRGQQWKHHLGHASGRVACLEFGPNEEVGVEKYEDASALRKHFEKRNPDASPTYPQRRLFLLEGCNDALRGVLSRELDVDLQVWARQDWMPKLDLSWDPTFNLGTKASLHSLVDPNETFRLDYFQLKLLILKDQEFSLRCAENGRRISLSRVDGKLDKVGQVTRRVSFWGRQRDVGGWDGM